MFKKKPTKVERVDINISTDRKYQVRRGDRVEFTAKILIDGDTLVDDYDAALEIITRRFKELMKAEFYV